MSLKLVMLLFIQCDHLQVLAGLHVLGVGSDVV